MELLLYPALRHVPAHERIAAKARATSEPFDLIEWVGMAFAIVFATTATRYSATGLLAVERLYMLALNFVVALPLLGLVAGPFLVRRTRRGLAKYLSERE